MRGPRKSKTDLEYMALPVCLLQLRLTISPGERIAARLVSLVHYNTDISRKKSLWRRIEEERLDVFSPEPR